MDTFPYESWEEAMTAAQELGEGFYTWGGSGSTAEVVLTILGCLTMVTALVMFVATERRNLAEHAKRIQDEGMI